MNKKGFSLIEMLAVIVLLAIIITLASIGVMSFKRNSENKLKEEKIKYIETGALRWGEENLNILNSNSCTYKYVSELISGGYISGDDDTKSDILIPGEIDASGNSVTFGDKCVCVKYENVYSGDMENASYIDKYGSTHYYGERYHGNTKFQVTASYGEGECE